MEFQIILIGDSGVGKTCLLRKYIDHVYDPDEEGDGDGKGKRATVVIDYYMTTREYEGKKARFDYWDSAGQEKYNSITRQYLRNVNAIAFVFDITEKKSLEKLAFWHDHIQENSKLKDRLLVLIGNKCDLIDLQQMTQESIDAKKTQLGCSAYYATSAKKDINVSECFAYIENELLKRPLVNITGKMQLDQENQGNKKCYC